MSKTNKYKKLQGKYINNKLSREEAIALSTLTLNNHNNLSMKERGNIFRNHKAALPEAQDDRNTAGGLYDVFAN